MSKVRVKSMETLAVETEFRGKSIPIEDGNGEFVRMQLDDYEAHIQAAAKAAAAEDAKAALQKANEAAASAGAASVSAADAAVKAGESAASASAAAESAGAASASAAEAAASVKAVEGKVTESAASAAAAEQSSAASAASAQAAETSSAASAASSAASAASSADAASSAAKADTRATSAETKAAGAETKAASAEAKAAAAETRAASADEAATASATSASESAASVKAVEGKVTESAASAAASAASAEAAKTTCDAMAEKVEEIMLATSDHIAAAWDGTTNERAVAEAGDKNLIDFDMMLIDHKDNKNEGVVPKILKKNNILRFKDGSYAPAVVITPEMKAQTDGDVYRIVNGLLVKYCGAGEYDAKKFYEEFGANEKLYDVQGTEIHALMPWETTSTDYSIMVGCDKTLYMIDNAVGKSGKVWKSISLSPHSWDGIRPIELAPTAINPSGVYCIEEGGLMKTRCMFALMEGLDKGYVHSKGHAGAGNVSTMFVGGRTYPTTNGINQMRNMEWARNNNADPTKSLPWAEGGFPYRNMFIAWLEILYARKDISNANFFGNGISHAYGMNHNTWMNEGGVRYKGEGDADWRYDAWGSKPSDLCYNTQGKQTSWSDMLNYQCPKEQCMESQLAASWAVENGIAEGQHFVMYGGEYWWQNVPGALGLNDGHMNVKVYKLVKGEVNAFTKEGVAKKVTAEAVLRMSLFEGVKLAGDVYQYCGGGYEVVGETLESSAGGGTYGEPVDIYLQPDQSKWHSETSTTKNAKGRFDFENTYPCIGHNKTKGGYALTTIPFSNFPLTLGGGLTKGDCYYFYNSNWWGYSTPGDRVRIGQRFGGYAVIDTCAPRVVFCYYSAAYTHVFYGGSAQVRLLQGIADA